jgi:hypothetical protein
MILYDKVYSWKGWGGKLKLGSGECRLRIYDMRRGKEKSVAHLKPIIVIISDLPDETDYSPSRMTVKSCASHIASSVVKEFGIDPSRMMWIEYYPESSEKEKLRYSKERFDLAEFTWYGRNATKALWNPLPEEMVTMAKRLMETSSTLSENDTPPSS